MRYRPLGDSGLLVSVVGLGCNNFGSRLDTEGARAVVDAAIDAGITLLDTSDTYGGGGGSESALGEILGRRRDQVVLATKFGHQSADMGYGPAAGGKVRYLGHSNFSGWQIADAAHLAAIGGQTPFISAQNHWSLLERAAEAEVVPAARHFGLGVLPFFPLANGLLTGKFRRGLQVPAGTRLAARPGYITDEKLVKVEALIDWSQAHGISILEAAIGALAAQPGCSSVIAGAMNAEQVKANAAASEWIPAAAELAEIDQIVPPPASTA